MNRVLIAAALGAVPQTEPDPAIGDIDLPDTVTYDVWVTADNQLRLSCGQDPDTSHDKSDSDRSGDGRSADVRRGVRVAHVLLRLDREDVGLARGIVRGESESGTGRRGEVQLANGEGESVRA